MGSRLVLSLANKLMSREQTGSFTLPLTFYNKL
jgi:hypothetical protein